MITASQKQKIEDLLLVSTPEEVYQMVLDGKLTRFPLGFWSMPENYKYGEACTRYLVEVVMGWDLETAKQQINLQTFAKNKLRSMITTLYGCSPVTAFVSAYPEVQVWECKATPLNYWNDDTARQNLRRIYLDELGYTREDLVNEPWIKSLNAKKLGRLPKLYGTVHGVLEVAFPEMAITQEELYCRSFCYLTLDEVANYIRNEYLPRVGAYSDEEVIHALSNRGVRSYEDWELFSYLYNIHMISLRDILNYTFPGRFRDWQICANQSMPWTLELLIEALRYKLYEEQQLTPEMVRKVWRSNIMERYNLCSTRTAYKLVDSSSTLYYYVTGELLS